MAKNKAIKQAKNKITVKPVKKIATAQNEYNEFSQPALDGSNAPVFGDQIVSVVDLNGGGNVSSPLLQDFPDPNQTMSPAQFPTLSDFSNNAYKMPDPTTFATQGANLSVTAPGTGMPGDTSTAPAGDYTKAIQTQDIVIGALVGVAIIVLAALIIKKIL